MDFESEEHLKRELGIESWRQMSKERLIGFVSTLPDMSKDVALKVIEQFPDFRNLVLDSLGELQLQSETAVKVNWKSQKRVHKAFQQYRDLLERELERDALTAEDRFTVLKLFADAVQGESEKDSQHKAFVLRATSIVATAVVVVVGAGAAVLGAKGKIAGRD